MLFLFGANYQNNLMLLPCYFLLALLLVNLLASYINFARIDLQIGKCPEVFVSDDLNVPLWLNANNNDIFPKKGSFNFTFQIDKHQFSRKTKTQRNQPNTQVDADAFSNPINLSQKYQNVES